METVLDTVDEGTTFEIVEILDNGWTHILYDNTDAYISSAYVIITSAITAVSGSEVST